MNFPVRPLTDTEQILWDEVLKAHALSARRENISTAVLRHAAIGSCDYMSAMIAASLSIGGAHAPIRLTLDFLTSEDPEGAARRMLGHGIRVPGWGNSFEKNGVDPIWKPVDEVFRQLYPRLGEQLDRITAVLHEAGKMIYPNPSAYTAITAIVLDVPPAVAPYIFIVGRFNEWTLEFVRILNNKEVTWAQ